MTIFPIPMDIKNAEILHGLQKRTLKLVLNMDGTVLLI